MGASLVSLDIMSHVGSVVVSVNNLHSARGSHFEGLGVRSILFSLLSHQTHIRDVAHGFNIKLAILSAVINNSLVHSSVRSIGNTALSILELVVLIPHLTSIADNTRHTGIDDDIRRNV